jgi:hypothetical protein
MNMEATAKCKKCGRALKNPLSVALGMGPKCAGVASSQGQRFHIGIQRSSGKVYNAVGAGGQQMPLLSFHPPEKKISRKERARRQREERRRLFDEHRSFQCGTMVRSKTPLMYEPVGDKEWKDSVSGRVMSQEQLQAYLRRHRFI